MDQTAARARRTSHIHLRAPEKARDLIERAADATGQTITDFVLNSATNHALDVLLDQRFLTLTPEQHAEFMCILDNPPPPNEKLKRLLASQAPWET